MELKRGVNASLRRHEGYIIKMLQVSGRVGQASFHGRLTVTVCDNNNFNGGAGRNRRLKTWIIRSHGIRKEQIMSLE